MSEGDAGSDAEDAPAGGVDARRTESQRTGLVEAVRIDLERLHRRWMEAAFPQLRDTHPVMGGWEPQTTGSRLAYRLWSVLGVLALAVLYPLVVLGFAARFHARQVDRAAVGLGAVGVVLLSVLVWGALAAATYLSDVSTEGFVAVAAAGGVATVSAVLALLFRRVGGRFTTVVFAYPFGVTAIFLPPVVAALYSPTVASVVIPSSDLVALWLYENLVTGALREFLVANFEFTGFAYVGMWFAVAVPVGWVLGLLVTLAELVRPSG